MMLRNIPVRRRRCGDGEHTIPRGRRSFSRFQPTCRPKPEAKAEGATAPETLRQKDRDRVMNFWKAGLRKQSPPKG